MRVSTLLLFGCLICSSIPTLRAQQEEKIKLDGGMPNRISMNVTVASTNKRSINDAKKGILNVIKIDMTEEGCRVLFPDTEFKINMEKLTIAATPAEPSARVHAGLQQAGSALAQGAQLVGGALPGGSIISAAVSSVSSCPEAVVVQRQPRMRQPADNSLSPDWFIRLRTTTAMRYWICRMEIIRWIWFL